MSACGLASVGNYIPIDKVRPDKSDAYVKKVQLKAQEMLARCKNMCDQSKVEAQILLVNGNDVVDTISNIVAQYQIQILVVGNPTSRSAFTRKSSGNRMSSKICKSVPSFCTAYVVSKDGLSSVYAPGSEIGSPSGSRVPKGSCSSSSSEIFSDGTSSISDMNNGSGQGLFGFPSLPSSNSASENLESSSSAEGLSKCLFLQLEVLSRIRHPHLLMLLGAYPDRGCLVYEYMENGSLADRLQRINGTPPIPWFHRFRIAWEIVSALVFLHSTKPSPIIHRDLKPENVLLDVNLVSKIGDVGLSTLVPLKESLSSRTVYKKTGLAGTLFYLDPEYQRTGQLSWGLSCLEMRSKNRPDLRSVVAVELERLKHIAATASEPAQAMPGLPGPPSHFMCPILKRVMQDPCIATDGYSYERNAIEMWLCENDVSPMTKARLPDKTLVPNRSLLCAITSWRSEGGDI
ncbi:hypothetical protein ACQ4PT_051205 [Festuca glaucescens]